MVTLYIFMSFDFLFFFFSSMSVSTSEIHIFSPDFRVDNIQFVECKFAVSRTKGFMFFQRGVKETHH